MYILKTSSEAEYDLG